MDNNLDKYIGETFIISSYDANEPYEDTVGNRYFIGFNSIDEIDSFRDDLDEYEYDKGEKLNLQPTSKLNEAPSKYKYIMIVKCIENESDYDPEYDDISNYEAVYYYKILAIYESDSKEWHGKLKDSKKKVKDSKPTFQDLINLIQDKNYSFNISIDNITPNSFHYNDLIDYFEGTIKFDNGKLFDYDDYTKNLLGTWSSVSDFINDWLERYRSHKGPKIFEKPLIFKFRDGIKIEVTDTKGKSKKEIIKEVKQVYKDFTNK